jgi:hypothetical protein
MGEIIDLILSFVGAVIVTTVSLALIVGLIFLIWFIYTRKMVNLKYFIKYKIFRKKYSEEIVELALEGLEDEEIMEKEMLLVGATPSTINEVKYMMKLLKSKGLKGGNEDNE